MGTGPWQFEIEVQRDGARIGAEPASVAACAEHVLYRAVQAGRLPNDGSRPDLTVMPRFSDGPDSAITGLSVALPGGAEEHFGLGVFEARARGLIRALVAEQGIPTGSLLRWRVLARPAAPPRFRVRALYAPYPLRPATLPEVQENALDVCFEAPVLRRIAAWAGPVEHAGLLLGVLLHDAERRSTQLRVEGLIELEPGAGGASDSHFSFPPQAFSDAIRSARGQGSSTVPCGWAHTHPPCADCPNRPACPVETVFFSASDAAVHASAFPSPFMIALVAGKLERLPATRPGFRLYGWDAARMAERPFRVVGPGSGAWAVDEHSFARKEP